MFLTKADLTTNITPEITALLTRYSEAVVDAHLVTAISTIRTYLAPRYDIGPELEKTGDARYGLLLNMGKDIAIYLLYSIAETTPAIRIKRYDEAMMMLKALARGEAALDGVPPVVIDPITPIAGGIAFGSNPRRPSLY